MRLATTLLLLALAAPVAAQVTRLDIKSREATGGYERITGEAHGEVDPGDRRNRIIQDLELAPRNPRGKVEYVATFALIKPADPTRFSGVLMYSVVNRGNGAPVESPEGHASLVSGWQGDIIPTPNNQTIRLPIAHDVTGPVLARFVDLPAGTTTASIRLGSMGSASYPPASLDTSRATLTFHTGETVTGAHAGTGTVAASEWAFADCRSKPFPGVPDATRVCLKSGFDPARLYELVYTARDPLVLGVGLAATRDLVSFFRYARTDQAGTPNPLAGAITHSVASGTSQAGNLLKTFVHLGFNEDLAGRIVWDGIFPFIAARQTPLNFRFAAPGGAAALYEPGSEPVLWWSKYADPRRGGKSASLLDRCRATNTCPTVFEAFGATEFWGLRMSPGLVGTDAAHDIPLPDNVRRSMHDPVDERSRQRTRRLGHRVGILRQRAAVVGGLGDLESAAAESLSDAGVGRPGRADARGDRVPVDSGPAVRRSIRQRRARLRPRGDVRLRGSVGRGRPSAAGDQARDSDARSARERRRQRDIGDSIDPSSGAARHLSRLEHPVQRLLQRTDLRLLGRLRAVRGHA